MSSKNKIKILKIALALISLTIFITMIIYLFPVVMKISTVEGQIEFKNKVESSGKFGLLILFGIQLLQIFLVIIPGEPIEILSGMCYGAFGGTIFIMISTCIISTIIFLLVRKYGKKLVYQFSDKKKIRKILNSKLFNNPKKIEIIMFILFLIPGTPKDLLVYVAGLLPIKPIRFILISTFARIPSIITSTLAGSNLVMGNWKLGISLYIIIMIVIAILILIIDKFDKDKTAKQAINIIK